MIFETHAHYDDEAFDIDREELFASMKEHGVDKIVNIGANLSTSEQTVALTKKYPFLYGAVGVHPSDVGELDEENFLRLKAMVNNEKIVAIGEIGLDYYWDTSDRETQKKWFYRQMDLAREVKLPAVIHSRDAAKDTLDFIKDANLAEVGGVIHCFSYGKEMAKEYLDMGFYLGIGGVLTFKNAKKLKEVVEYAPIEQLVLETDCPYLAPEPYRGKRNSSLYLKFVAEAIASLKQIDYEDVLEITYKNAMALYNIKKEV